MPQVLEAQGMCESIHGGAGRGRPEGLRPTAQQRSKRRPRSLPTNDLTATGAGLVVSALEQLAEARVFTRLRLTGWSTSEKVEDIALLVTEMVANALLHTRGPASLDLVVEGDRARVLVGDSSTELPQVREVDMESGCGRGLMIVESLASGWGVAETGAGKTVWAVVER